MSYEEKLFNALINPDGYLWWEDSYPISSLSALAEEALGNNTIEGKITALFIYHQLNQEILNLLLRYCDLIVRSSIYPIKVSEESKRENLDFGLALKKLQITIEFKNKSKIISESQQLNRLRNEFAHGLVKNHYNQELNDELTSVQHRFETIFDNWQESMKWFYDEFDRIKSRTEIQKGLIKFKVISKASNC
jgi:hypothetical protein